MLITISFIFLYYTYKNFSIDDLKTSIKNVTYLTIFLYLFIFIPIILILSQKYIILIENYKEISLKDSTVINLIAFLYNIFLPAKIGDIFRVFHSNVSKKFYTNCIILTFFEKIISFCCLIFIVIICSKIQINFILAAVFLFIFYLFFSKYNTQKLFTIINRILIFFSKKEYKLKQELLSDIRGKIIKFFIIDILIWSLIFFQIFLISIDIDLNLSFIDICFIFGCSILIGLMPISFGGFGLRDIIILNSLQGYISQNDILTLLFFFNLRYFIPAIFGFIFNTLRLYDKKI